MHSIALSTVSLALALLSASTNAQSTVTGVSQISDGQIQAPTGTTTSAADPAVITTTSAPYENPFTIYTTQTNSLGIITGMPEVVTSQPEVVTSQPPSATLPSLSGYWYGNETTTAASSTETGETQPTTFVTSTASGSGSSTGASGSRSASATFAQSTGAAVSGKIVGAGMGLVVLALGFSML